MTQHFDLTGGENDDAANNLLNTLHSRLADGLTEYEQGVFDTLNWLIDNADPPELD